MSMIGHGRPVRAVALAALALVPVLLLAPPAARAASPYGNVVEVSLPRPGGSEVLLARVQVQMQLRRGGVPEGGLGRLPVRSAGGSVPSGFAVAAVQARPRGATATVRLAAVRTSDGARSGRPLRVRLRIGGRRVVYRRAQTATVPIRPRTRVRRSPDCRTIVGEARRWRPVTGRAFVRLGGERFSAKNAVGAAQQIACGRRIGSVAPTAAARFLDAVAPAFAGGAPSSPEGFFATWAKNPDGSARLCVYVRGDRAGEGDVTAAGRTQPFALSGDRGVALTVFEVPGEGEYPFRVRWRRPDGTLRRSRSSQGVPAGAVDGAGPPSPYAAAGPCA